MIGVIGTSYALFSVSVEKPKTFTLISGNLTYLISSTQLSSNKVTVPVNNTITLDVIIESQNTIESNYILYYLNALSSGTTISYIASNDLPNGTIGAKGTKKTVKLNISNASSITVTIQLGVKGGLAGKSLTLDNNQSSITRKLYVDTSGASIPELDAGMIPVYYDGNTLKKADTTTEWYNYSDKKWANAILVNSTSRATYQNAVGGTNINTADVLAYFVWIPRYRYKLFNVEGRVATTPQTIEIIFEDKNTPKSTGTMNGSYLTPQGFTFGTQELNGFWVGKFETTGDTTKPTILPNMAALTMQNVSTLFETTQKFQANTYGLTSESKMIKNSEWGAIAYLSHSKYGINTEVRNNNYRDDANQKTRTGCGALVPTITSSTCDIAYGSSANYLYPQSTTGNITGIFNMSGGAWDYAMGVFADPSGKQRSGKNTNLNSGYTGMLSNGTTYNGKSFPPTKYYDLYIGTSCLGQTLVETAQWYQDSNYAVNADSPWMIRGGSYGSSTGAGLFDIYATYGYPCTDCTTRTIVVPAS